MQAIILAAGRGKRLNKLTENNNKCMIRINGITLIERLLKQLELYGLDRIVIVDGYQKDNLEEFISSLNIKTEIKYVSNNDYSNTDSMYSLYLAKEYLNKGDSLIIESDLIFDNKILSKFISDNSSASVLVDIYKNWMNGKTVITNDKNEIIRFMQDNKLNYLDYHDSLKTVGMYKFSCKYSKKFLVPFLETYIKSYGKNHKFEIILDYLINESDSKIVTSFIGNNDWYEINDIQDVDLASIMFSENEELIVEKMLGRWGGYWRYPQYLDYFYLVTPYYPTKALVEEIKANFENLLYQYPSGMKVNSLLAAKEFMVEPDNIIIGNGAAELIKSIMTTIKGKTGFIKPTFDEYPNRLTKEEHVNYYVTSDDFTYSADDVINYFKDKDLLNLILVNPENPSGNYINKKNMRKLLEWTKKENIKFIVDESFVDFVDEDNPTLIKQEILDEFTNLYVIKSISKSYGIPGLRLGILASGDKSTIAWMKKDVSIWNINSFAEFYMQIAGKYRKDYDKALATFRLERTSFSNALKEIKELRVIPSQANYIMVELLDGLDAEYLKQKMLIDEKIFIKTLGKKIKNGRNYLRLAIRNHEDNAKFIDALQRVIHEIN